MADPAKPIRKSDLTSAMDVAKAAMPAIDSALRSSNRTQAIAIEAAPLRANKPGVIEALRTLYPDWSIEMDIRGGRAEIETLVFKPSSSLIRAAAQTIALAAVPAINRALENAYQGDSIAIEAAPLNANKPGVIEALRALYPDWSIKMDIRGGRDEIETLVFS